MDIRRTALVTGGSRGIGRGIAMAFAEAGYDVTIGHWQDDGQAAATAAVIRDRWGRDCHVVPGDLSDAATATATAAEAIGRMGQIDVLVNNAGICLFDGIAEQSPDALDLLLMLNFRAPLLLMKEVSRHMIAAGIRGSLLNITSSRAERAYRGDAVYGGLKAGLKRASESVALDLAPHGIRVNCVAPGAILVRAPSVFSDELGPRIPLGRMGLPEDVGRICVWLASESSAYVTGINLRADGGLILPGMPEGPEYSRRPW
ncbi:SDR family NAD(P)-dependent oxidoreductase [Cohnella nanjingensis]|uniref:SDR family oxidoreductase n=1 Tax=Cohnella nanjingensis TaxID=1387779 RepID=A0A7X0RNW0_9BACL|nr:SDR family oxidoreductase [Cohnella nanjingensis]MBB6670979.1 SDR family oxidoreductase [Cohnella nanjingensis]